MPDHTLTMAPSAPAAVPNAASQGERDSPKQRVRRGRGYHRSGFYALKVTLKELGPRVIDKRTALGKALAAWKADLERDLGGNPSAAQLAIIALVCRQRLLLESVDAWLITQPTLINRRKKALLPVLRERQQLADSLAKYLGQLGLERREEDAADVTRVLEAIHGKREVRTQTPTAEVTP